MGLIVNVFNLLFAWMPNWVRLMMVGIIAVIAFIIVFKIVAFILDSLPFV